MPTPDGFVQATSSFIPPSYEDAPRESCRHLAYAFQMLNALRAIRPDLQNDQTYCLAMEHLKKGIALAQARLEYRPRNHDEPAHG